VSLSEEEEVFIAMRIGRRLINKDTGNENKPKVESSNNNTKVQIDALKKEIERVNNNNNNLKKEVEEVKNNLKEEVAQIKNEEKNLSGALIKTKDWIKSLVFKKEPLLNEVVEEEIVEQ
jgi:peptidoglycan hydrolase CwlO-like protein